jgi:hypothetical protein
MMSLQPDFFKNPLGPKKMSEPHIGFLKALEIQTFKMIVDKAVRILRRTKKKITEKEMFLTVKTLTIMSLK